MFCNREPDTILPVKTPEELAAFAVERKEDVRVCRELSEFFRLAAAVNETASDDAQALSKLVANYPDLLHSEAEKLVQRHYDGMKRIRAGTRFFSRLERWGQDLITWYNAHSNGPPPEMPASPMPKNTGIL